MSRYQELCAEYLEALTRFNQYTDDCCSFAEEFFATLQNHFECPADSVRFYAPQEELDTLKNCTLHKAMLHNSDGFYAIYFSLTLKETTSEDTVLIVLRVKKLDHCFRVKIGMNRKEFEISTKEDLPAIFDYIYDGIKNYYQKDGFIKSTASPIGFAI